MTNDSSSTGITPFAIERSSYYQHWLQEKQAIEEHKWFLSEKVGCDVGFPFAQWDWIMAGHRSRWLLNLRQSGVQI